MDQKMIQMLFALLRSSLCGKKLSEDANVQLSREQMEALLATAKKHDVTHLIALGLKQKGLGKELGIEKHILQAVYRYEQQRVEFEKLCEAFEAAKIPFIPLKGAVIRGHYPEAWMRTSCDTDILVKECDVERASAALINGCGYVQAGRGAYDISLYAPNKTHVELHYALGEKRLANVARVLDCVWEKAQVRPGHACWCEMPDEMFYFYHIAHMVKHFDNGGCGIKPFIDVWIMDNRLNVPRDRCDDLLAQGGLLKFAQTVRRLSRVWFHAGEHDALTRRMEEYILRGGVYGTAENRITVQQQKEGGRLKYALSKIFLSRQKLEVQYPVLKKHQWLTPVLEVCRWFRLAFCGHAKRTIGELKYSGNISKETAADMQAFLKDIGL